MSGIKGERYIDESGNEVLTGGLKAAATTKAKYGPNFYVKIGRLGGTNGHSGGFASNRELARTAGAKGGRMSKRGAKAVAPTKIEPRKEEIEEMYYGGESIPQIAAKIGVSAGTLRKWAHNNLDGYGYTWGE